MYREYSREKTSSSFMSTMDTSPAQEGKRSRFKSLGYIYNSLISEGPVPGWSSRATSMRRSSLVSCAVRESEKGRGGEKMERERE